MDQITVWSICTRLWFSLVVRILQYAKPVSIETRATGVDALTRVNHGYVHYQLITLTPIQTISAHSHHLHYIAGVGLQVLDDGSL